MVVPREIWTGRRLESANSFTQLLTAGKVVPGDPAVYGDPQKHRDVTISAYVQDSAGNYVEILALG
ncbi:MAG: hypothetical protein WBL50_08400 [Candidatus Acidiferrum sp.]